MILIIDNYDSFTYNLYQRIALFYSNIRVVRNDRISVAEINQLNPKGIILSPGPGHPENAGICIELIRMLVSFSSQIPLLGVCLGHQAIISALGGKIIQSTDMMHGEGDLVFHYRQGIYKKMPMPFTAGRYHSLIADRAFLPSALLVEAENASGLIMGVRHEKLPIYGVQFHPESILTPMGDQFLQEFLDIV